MDEVEVSDFFGDEGDLSESKYEIENLKFIEAMFYWKLLPGEITEKILDYRYCQDHRDNMKEVMADLVSNWWTALRRRGHWVRTKNKQPYI